MNVTQDKNTSSVEQYSRFARRTVLNNKYYGYDYVPNVDLRRVKRVQRRQKIPYTRSSSGTVDMIKKKIFNSLKTILSARQSLGKFNRSNNIDCDYGTFVHLFIRKRIHHASRKPWNVERFSIRSICSKATLARIIDAVPEIKKVKGGVCVLQDRKSVV